MDCLVLFPYDEQSYLDVMDTLFFVGVNAGLLILLIFGLVSAKAKINAGRKEIVCGWLAHNQKPRPSRSRISRRSCW